MDRNPESFRRPYAEYDLNNIHRILSMLEYILGDLISAIHVCFLVDWDPRASAKVWITRINRMLNRVRASRASKETYMLLLHLHMVPDRSGVFPYDLESRRRVIAKFSLFH